MSLPYGYSLIPFSLKLLEPQLWGLITDDTSISSPFQRKVEQVCLNYPLYWNALLQWITDEGMVTTCWRVVIAHRHQHHGTGGTLGSHLFQSPSAGRLVTYLRSSQSQLYLAKAGTCSKKEILHQHVAACLVSDTLIFIITCQ